MLGIYILVLLENAKSLCSQEKTTRNAQNEPIIVLIENIVHLN